VTITDARGFGRWLAAQHGAITTAAGWHPAPGVPKNPPGTTLNIAFTYKGLEALRLDAKVLESFPVEFQDGIASSDRASIPGDTGESEPKNWEFGGSDSKPVHAVLIVFATDRPELESRIAALRACLEGLAAIGSEQAGARPAHGKEHFGFSDGIGQPSIRRIGREGGRAGEFLLGHENEYGFFTPGPVVDAAADPERLLPECASPASRRPARAGLSGLCCRRRFGRRHFTRGEGLTNPAALGNRPCDCPGAVKLRLTPTQSSPAACW